MSKFNGPGPKNKPDVVRSRRGKLIIAIDGPAGSGKSTIAKLVAKILKIPYVDTGAMYRAVTLKAIQSGIKLTDSNALARLAKKVKIDFKDVRGKQHVILDGQDVTKAIRTPELTKNVFYAAQEPKVRAELVKKQRELGSKRGAVMEGRDIGTVVFPKADYKIFMDATPELRATRRYKELIAEGKKVAYKDVLKDLLARDVKDRTRKKGPLKRAKDAFYVDTTGLTIPVNVDRILAIVSGPKKA